MRSASRALEVARLQLEEVESGRITPPAPSVIPMADYYYQSEIDYEEAMQSRRELEETCSRLESITTEQMSKSQRDRMQQQLERQSASASKPSAEDSASFTAARRTSKREGSIRLSPKKSLLLSPRNTRKQSQVDGGSTSQSFTGSRSSSPTSQRKSLVLCAVEGGESLSDALTKLDRIKAVLASTKINPVVNPYKNVDAAEAEKRRMLRPHTVTLLESSSTSCTIPTELDRCLKEAQEVLRVERNKAEEQRAREEAQQEDARKAYRQGIDEWRGLESAQLELVYRHAVERANNESEYWSIQNHRERHILEKVSDIHQKAKSQEALKLRERESLAQLSKISEARVAMECFEQEEECNRRALMAAERTIFEESIRTPLHLAEASVAFEQRRVGYFSSPLAIAHSLQ